MMRFVAIALLLSGAVALEQTRHRVFEVSNVEVPEEFLKGLSDVFPVPTTSRCIVILCIQYMIVYTALAVCRTFQEFSGTGGAKRAEAGLRAAAQTMTYGPMICVLFIACRMRVEFLSDGQEEPQNWVQNCMYALTFAVMGSTILVLVLPLITGNPLPPKEADLEQSDEAERNSMCCLFALTIVRYLILVGLYGGLAGVIWGICTYLPAGHTDLSKLPAPAPAVSCTMILAVVFFSTQLVIAVCRSFGEFTGIQFPKIVGMMNAAATTVEFAPMLSILFLAARMRALQHDGQPQPWAQVCMYVATIAMCLTTVLACAVPLAMGGSMQINSVTKETTFEAPNPCLGYFLVALRYLCMLGFYGGAVGVAYSIFTFEAPGGPRATLPVSPTVQCVVNLTCQFFSVYLMATVMLTISELSGGRLAMENTKFFAAIDSAKSTLAFAPMLSILFVTTRMYAMLLTDRKGAPQAWVQDGMYMATWSLLISFLMCLACGVVMDKVDTDEDGNVVNKSSNQFVGIITTAIRYLSMLLLYGGMTMVIVGLFVMTPENANGRGSVPFVTDAINNTPLGNAPPGPKEAAEAVARAAGAATSFLATLS